MDFETAMELVADRYGSVEWGLVQEAADWLVANGYDTELCMLLGIEED